jgi:hypothetical protein
MTRLELSPCADFKQFDLRASKSFNLDGSLRLRIIGEGFNLTNAKNTGGFVSSMASSQFGKPTTYAGDFQRGEQRLFQLAARIEF